MDKTEKIPNHIANQADLEDGLLVLRDIDPVLGKIIDGLSDVPLRNRSPGFEGLAEIVVSQHVSKASAAAVFGRLLTAIVPFDPKHFLIAGERVLIDSGLSRAKQKALIVLAQTIMTDGFDLKTLCTLPVEHAQSTLIALPGIGPWTAEIFLMFCAGHPDIFPAGDVALQHIAGQIAGLDKKPDEKACREIAKRWAPLRSVAARVLYARYAQIKERDIMPV